MKARMPFLAPLRKMNTSDESLPGPGSPATPQAKPSRRVPFHIPISSAVVGFPLSSLAASI